jgi:putative ABC transport system permease protein
MSSIMTVLLVMLGICLLVILWIALRRTVMFKIGLRNIPRRPAQSILVIIGLMLSTLIIAAALGTGDTIDYSATALTYESLGDADELVVHSTTGDGEGSVASAIQQRIPQTVVDDLEAMFADSDLVDGLMPLLIEQVPVFLFPGGPPAADADMTAMLADGTVTQAEPSAYLAGIDPARAEQFGHLKSSDGEIIDLAALPADQVVISETMAEDLNASVGDGIGFFYANNPFVLTVAAIAEDSALSGRFDADTPSMVLDLATMQSLVDAEGEITAVAVSNRGDMRSGMELTDEVSDVIKAGIAGRDLGVDPIKQDSIDLANLLSSVFTTFFILFGLFSIAVGILLIILIFSMLAAERRPEMGMTRAVGGQRSQLIQSFIAEGTIYALFAGLIGALLGAAGAYLIAWSLNSIFGEFFEVEAHVTLRSMVVAYCLGVVITFIAVVVASWRNSHLNIVAAVRDIPDFVSPVRRRRTLVWAILALVVGALSAMSGLSSDSAFVAYFGLSLIPFGVAMILRYLGVSSRIVFSIVGAYLIVLWLLPDSWSRKIFGNLDGDIEMFFLSGIFLVAGATMVMVQNLDALLWVLSKFGSVFRSAQPSMKTAIAFPSQAPTRTGMTIAMFSLIVFSLVVFSTINENFVNIFLGDDANAGWDIRADQTTANPIGSTDDVVQLLNDRGVDTSQIAAIGAGTTYFQGQVNRVGGDPGTYILHGIDNDLISESTLKFQQRASGFDSDEAIVEALLNDPTVAVIDSFALAQNQGFGGTDDQFNLGDPDGDGPETGLDPDMDSFEPIAIQIEGADGQLHDLTIIGIIDQKIGSLFGLYVNDAVMQQIQPNPQLISYFMRLNDSSQSREFAQQVEAALLVNGVDAVSIKDELEDSQDQNRGFLYIIQGFMALGLIVGLAAVGVIAFRAVVERRQQIGVLRAIGFQPGMVTLSFLAEQLFVVAMGAISGAVLGLALAKILFMSDDFAPSGTDFLVPWAQIIVLIAVTLIAAALMTFIPARQASKLAPAEALRYE